MKEIKLEEKETKEETVKKKEEKDKVKKDEKEDNVYNHFEELLENDEISEEEEGFMKGYTEK
ncbi:MAG: hypothetical protein V1725_04865 [archaeon]